MLAACVRALWPVLVGLVVAGCPPTIDRLLLRVAVRVPEVEGVVWTEASWQGRAIRLRPCDDDGTEDLGWPSLPEGTPLLPADPDPMPWTIGLTGPLDALAPAWTRGFAAPYCAVDLIGKGPLRLVGDGPLGPVEVEVEVPDMAAVGVAAAPHGDAPGEVQPAVVLVRVGGAGFAAEIASRAASGPVAIAPGTPDHDVLLDLLVVESAVWIDTDDDAALSPEEAAAPPWVALEVVLPEP